MSPPRRRRQAGRARGTADRSAPLAGRFAEAIGPACEVADIQTRFQCADHWQTQGAQRTVEDLKRIAALSEEGRLARSSVALACFSRPCEAWARWETDLVRGLLDARIARFAAKALCWRVSRGASS